MTAIVIAAAASLGLNAPSSVPSVHVVKPRPETFQWHHQLDDMRILTFRFFSAYAALVRH